MSTTYVTLTEDIYYVSVTTVENVINAITTIDTYYVSVGEDSYKLITTEEETYNVTISDDVYRVTSGEEEVYNVSVIMSGGGSGGDTTGGIASIGDLVPKGDFDKQDIIWSVSQDEWIKNPDPTPKGEGGVPLYISLDGTNLAEGYSSLIDSSTVWTTGKAILKEIIVETSSLDWFLAINPRAGGATGEVPSRIVMDRGSGNETIFLDMAYEDEDNSNKVHLDITDYDGAKTFQIHIVGSELL